MSPYKFIYPTGTISEIAAGEKIDVFRNDDQYETGETFEGELWKQTKCFRDNVDSSNGDSLQHSASSNYISVLNSFVVQLNEIMFTI